MSDLTLTPAEARAILEFLRQIPACRAAFAMSASLQRADKKESDPPTPDEDGEEQ